MNKHLYRGILWGMTLLLMAFIFGFSAQPGPESGKLSRMIAQPITDWLLAHRAEVSMEEAELLYAQVSHIVRKAAHFSEYTVLGLLWAAVLRSYGRRQWWMPWIIGTLYAASDEYHQLFMPGRAGQVQDVLLDSFGVLFGVVFLIVTEMIWRKRHADHS